MTMKAMNASKRTIRSTKHERELSAIRILPRGLCLLTSRLSLPFPLMNRTIPKGKPKKCRFTKISLIVYFWGGMTMFLVLPV